MTSPSAGPRHGPPRDRQYPPDQRPQADRPYPSEPRQADRPYSPEQRPQAERQRHPEPRPQSERQYPQETRPQADRQNAPEPATTDRQQPRTEPPTPAPAVSPVPRESTAVFTLRVTTYVLTSLASLVFLALVVYGYVALQDLGNRLSATPLFGGGQSPSSYEVPTQGQLCATNPDAPECRITDAVPPTP